MNWMIYGATGFTGKLAVQVAVDQGLTPVIAARNATKLQPIAEKSGLEAVAFPVESPEAIAKHLLDHDIKLVLHLAGPYAFTGDPMLQACLIAGAHYLDITGEPDAFHNAYSFHEQAIEKNTVIMPGVGFDIVPSDCLIKHVADQLPDANKLEVAFDFRGETLSRGTLKSGLEMVASVGNLLRRDGELQPVRFASEKQTVPFMKGEAVVKQCMWGDIITGYRTTGIPNITTYFAFDRPIERQFGLLHKIRPLLKFGFVRRFLSKQLDKEPEGPTEDLQRTARADLYARVTNAAGERKEAWLQTCEGYRFTALSAVYCANRVLNENLSGALTPAAAFGADAVLEIEGTIRKDSLTEAPCKTS